MNMERFRLASVADDEEFRRQLHGLVPVGSADPGVSVALEPVSAREATPASDGALDGGGLVGPVGWPADVPRPEVAARHVKPRLIPSDRRPFRGVTAFVGLPGSGKTYSLAEVGVGYQAKGWDVWCNKGFDLVGAQVYSSFEELAAIRGPAAVLIDEAQLFFNSRRWQEFPDGFLYSLTQVRKLELHLYFTALRWGSIDVNLREMTFWVWECEQKMSFRGARFVRRRLPPEQVRKKDERPADTHHVRVRREIASYYDTMGTVAVGQGRARRDRDGERWALPSVSEGAPRPETGGGDQREPGRVRQTGPIRQPRARKA